MPTHEDIVLDEWRVAHDKIKSGLLTLYVLGMEKGAVIDSIIDLWDDTVDGERQRHDDKPS